MGQDQSKAVDPPISDPEREEISSASSDKSPPSMESLLEEATAFGNQDENASLEEKAQKALECPCIQNLKKGPCGPQFTDAFKCFLTSTAEEKGSDCVQPFVALQKCIQTNPNAFPKYVLENDEAESVAQKPVEDYKIIPPGWAVDSPSPRPRQKL